MIRVQFEAHDGEKVWATGKSLEALLKGLNGEQMNDKTWMVRSITQVA